MKNLLLDREFLRRLEVLDFFAGKIVSGEMVGERSSASRRSGGTLFREYRPMTHGDDLRYVDWNVFARSRVQVIKEFEPEEELEVVIFIDASASMSFGDPGKFDYARHVAAALTFIGLRRMESVRIVSCGSHVVPRAFRGPAQVVPAFDFLKSLEPGGGTAPLRSVSSVAGTFRSRGVALLVSDFYDVDSAEHALSFLVHQRFRVHAVHVVAPQEVRPPIGGPVRLRDAESGRMVTMQVTRAALHAYREAFARHCAHVETACHRREVGYVRIETTEPFDNALRRLLSQHECFR